jgi:hypothetical protein
MTASYVGGGVNFVAVAETYEIKPELTNPLLVADNFVMAGLFVVLLSIAASRFFRHRYPHPHSLAGDQEDTRALAARYWRRKEISLLDIAKALGIAFGVAAVSVQVTSLLKAQVESKILESLFANPFVLITILSVAITTLFHRWTEKIEGAEDLGMYLLYLFFVVIGLRADFVEVVKNMPVLFLFCSVMAATNLCFTLAIGRLLRLNLEELLLSVNATLGARRQRRPWRFHAVGRNSSSRTAGRHLGACHRHLRRHRRERGRALGVPRLSAHGGGHESEPFPGSHSSRWSRIGYPEFQISNARCRFAIPIFPSDLMENAPPFPRRVHRGLCPSQFQLAPCPIGSAFAIRRVDA